MKFNVSEDEFEKSVHSEKQKAWFKQELTDFAKETLDDKPDYRVVMVVSRHKDNQTIKGFKPTSRAELLNINDFDSKDQLEKYLVTKYAYLANDGEVFRIYQSVNARNIAKVKQQLMHALIDDRMPLDYVQSKVASLAAKPECALTHQWLLDVDYPKPVIETEVIPNILKASGFNRDDLTIFTTYINYGIIVPHSFDTRELLVQYPELEVKKDDMQFLASFEKKGRELNE